MSQVHYKKIAQELQISDHQVAATVGLLDNEATVPFIARYRKEVTGMLDEVQITKIRDRITQLRDLDKRKESILKSIEEQGKLTDELKSKIEKADTMAHLEDIYLPYKPKRRTKATIAKEKGLEGLADLIFEQKDLTNPEIEAEKYLNPTLEVNSIEDAIGGARDILAEKINEQAEVRAKMRDFFWEKAQYKSKVIAGKEADAAKYKDYFDWSEPVKTAPSHRVLALRRAEKELFLTVDIAPPEEDALHIIEKNIIKSRNLCSEQLIVTIKDCYKRLLKPSMETEVRLRSKKQADEEAIKVFTDNLKELLLSPPLGQKNVLAIDPGFRTGCKVVCLDKQGKLLDHDVIFPDRRATEATMTMKKLCEKYAIEAIAIGNGTASRETDMFVRNLDLPKEISILMVNENGASVYSASETAREEFPDYDITVRGAVSIGRRLADPLAELVKIDPKAIGVGQYQHDVDQNNLKQSLDDVVMSCVNAVGVEVNTASKELLTYVSGLGPQLALNILEYRNRNGAFRSREELKRVSRLGDKAFEQAAGFLRIAGAHNPLDASAVHPESYPIIEKMASDLNCKVDELLQKEDLRKKIDPKKYVTETIGLPTLKDIVAELAKPGRDPREPFQLFEFSESVKKIDDLTVGMSLKGVITNVTNFGAFVDIGVHVNGLIHISNMSDKFISNPSEVVKVHQKVEVTVIEVDLGRQRIALSMAKPEAKEVKKPEVKIKSEIKTQEKSKQSQQNNKFSKDVKPKKNTFVKPTVEKKQEVKKEETSEEFMAKLLELKNKFK